MIRLPNEPTPVLPRRACGARSLATALVAALALQACSDERHFARVFEIAEMAQVIGGPAAAARPGDYLLENDHIRAVIHGRHNARSTMPLSNGSLIDLDIQRPHHQHGVGKGEDAFYELGGMVNLKVNSSREMAYGPAGEVGVAEPPASGCVRVTAKGPGENFMGVLGLLDLAMTRPYPANDLQLVTDYDVCPGEPLVRVTTTARFYGEGEPLELEPLDGPTSLLATLLGESLKEPDCAVDPCPAGTECDDMLRNLSLGALSTEMKRCRKPEHRLAGVMAGDLVLMSGKVRTFTPGSGFDHDTYVRSVFDSGGDIFSNPLALDFVAAVSDDVSYAYFEPRGKLMIPVFSESFTVSMTNGFACPREDPKCMEGKELRYHRVVSVGHGDVASALAGYYKVRGIPTGQVEGHVTDVRTGAPVSGMHIFVARLPASWESLSDREIAARSYEQLIAANQDETRTETRPLGEVGIISHFRSDPGLDPLKDGSFGGPLPVGRYALVARDAERLASPLVPIRVTEGQSAKASLFAGERGRLEYDLLDEAGRHLPGKLTIGRCFAECARDEDCVEADTPYCFVGSRASCETGADCGAQETCTIRGCVAVGPLAGLCTPTPDGRYRSEKECRPDQSWDAARSTCVCRSLALPLELKGRRNADGTELTKVSGGGQGVLQLPPGTYQVVASRGPEYEIERAFVTLRPGSTTRFSAVLPRVVDTTGWISADFHVHGPNSVDSGMDHHTRVKSYAAEGIELLSASDHDQLTDYAPTIHDLKLGRWMKSQVGLEVSPLDYGHFLGFPLIFDENAELNGAFHWRTHKADDADPDWQNMPPPQIFNELRKRGAFGAQDTVVAVAHFYDHFTFYGVDPWTLELPPFSITAMSNLVLLPSNFSGEFDALEGFNGKGLDLLRRPSFREVRDYNVRVAEILGDTSKPYIERQRAWAKVSAEAQRSFFVRSEQEQQRSLSANPDFACRCSADAECGPGSLCDERTGDCIRSCCREGSDGVECSDGFCDAALVAAGRERCQPHAGDEENRTLKRFTCQRVAQRCSRNAECLRVSWDERAEDCVAVDPAAPAARTCELACGSDRDCGDPLRSQCIDKRCQARAVTAAADDDLCPTLRGTLDDWFQLLNHGVRRTMLGNSDSHDTYGGEAGLPRNYVRSSADMPPAIDRLEIARNVKAGKSFATYGPFVEVSLNGQPLGATVTVQQGARVKLRVKVQSPKWFDVDRLEIYRNAELIRVITGRTDCAKGEVNCIRVPNDAVVNFDQELEDQPPDDAWYAVVAMGAEGRALAPVYSSTPVARLGIFELIQRLTPLLPPLRSLRTPFAPSITEVRPYAVTNPIFVDVGGDGYQAPLPPPGWASVPETAEPAAQGKSDALQLGLGQGAAPQAAGHSHDHRRGIGRMRAEAADLSQLLRQGKVTQKDLQRAFDALRYLR